MNNWLIRTSVVLHESLMLTRYQLEIPKLPVARLLSFFLKVTLKIKTFVPTACTAIPGEKYLCSLICREDSDFIFKHFVVAYSLYTLLLYGEQITLCKLLENMFTFRMPKLMSNPLAKPLHVYHKLSNLLWKNHLRCNAI